MKKSILIVDDHDDLASLLTKEFTKSGHSVKILANRSEAVDLIETERFDLVISDLDGEQLVVETGEPDAECLPDEVESSRSSIKAFKICITNYDKENFSEDELKF